MGEFYHRQMDAAGERKMVYTATSKHYFYLRAQISKFVMEEGFVPLNPFMIFDYYMLSMTDHIHVLEGDNTLVRRSDELWVFGPVSDGVLSEIILAEKNGKPVRFFEVVDRHDFSEIGRDKVRMEENVEEFRHLI